MSERLSLSDLAEIQTSGGAFSERAVRSSGTPGPTHHGAPVHFAPAHPGERMGNEASVFPDPDGDPLRAAWSEGYQAGLAEPGSHHMPFQTEAIAEQIAGLREGIDARLAHQLQVAVVALARQLLTDAPFDESSLQRRIGVALEMLGPAPGLTCRCHPDALDSARSMLPADVAVRADLALAPNGFELDHDTGGVAEGPEEWARALSQALARC